MNFDGLKNVEWGPVAGQLMKIGAPILGTVIGGVPGAIAGNLIGSLASAIGAPEATPESISTTLQDPAAQACGTFAPRYCTGKLAPLRGTPEYSSGNWFSRKWLAASLMSRAMLFTSRTKPYRLKPSTIKLLSCGQTDPFW